MRFYVRASSARYRLEPDHRLAEVGAERLAFRVGKRGLARLADRGRLLRRSGGGRVLDERVEDRQEVSLAAAVGLAVALDEARARRHLECQVGVAARRLARQGEPALDEPLLLAVAV